jgi:hypothetical protein
MLVATLVSGKSKNSHAPRRVIRYFRFRRLAFFDDFDGRAAFAGLFRREAPSRGRGARARDEIDDESRFRCTSVKRTWSPTVW